jgi:membrane protease YdiL (CAAX protease family)
MLANSLDKSKGHTKKYRWGRAALVFAWVAVAYAFVQSITLGVVVWLRDLDNSPLNYINESVLNTIFSASVYLLTLIIVVGVPWLIKRRTTTRSELGLQRLPSWLDIGLAPAGFIVYFIISAILITIFAALIPGIDIEQVQQNGFENIGQRYEYILAFATLVVVAPLAEEILFRGYLYGKVRTKIPIWAAALLVSLIFAVVHMQWNVGIDVFALSIVLCALREITGSIWSGVLLHMLKNGVAFYFLFVNPLIV